MELQRRSGVLPATVCKKKKKKSFDDDASGKGKECFQWSLEDYSCPRGRGRDEEVGQPS